MGVISNSLATVIALSASTIYAYLLYSFLQKDQDDDFTERYLESSKYIQLEIDHKYKYVHGSAIRLIKEKSNALIFSKPRKLIIRGSPEACTIAEQVFREILSCEPVIKCKDYLVPENWKRIFLRDYAKGIKFTQSVSGTHISFSFYSGKECKMTVIGTEEEHVYAHYLIKKHMSQYCKEIPPFWPVQSIIHKRVHFKYPVFVSAVISPSEFWFQIPDTLPDLECLSNRLEEYYNDVANQKMHSLHTVSVGDMVAALYPDQDVWERAIVIDVTVDENNVKMVKVLYIDYGLNQLLTFDQICELIPEFSSDLPFAYEGFMADIAPCNGISWSTEEIKSFQDLTAGHTLRFNIICLGKRKNHTSILENNVLGIKFYEYDKEPSPGSDVSRKLVIDGRALYLGDIPLTIVQELTY